MTVPCRRLRCQDGKCLCGTEEKPKKCGAVFDNSLPQAEELISPELRKTRKEGLEEIKSTLTEGKNNLTLVLGAGISIPMGMPNWISLISKMSGYVFRYEDYASKQEPENRERAIRLEEALIEGKLDILEGINVLESAQYIYQVLIEEGGPNAHQIADEKMKGIVSAIIDKSKKPMKFLAELSCLRKFYIQYPDNIPDEAHDFRDKVLELHKKVFPDGADGPKWDTVTSDEIKRLDLPEQCLTLNHLRHRDEVMLGIAKDNTLCAVAALLSMKGGFQRAITYNYDMLVEEYLTGIFGMESNQVVSHTETWTACTGKEKVQIFHVHGRIPRTDAEGHKKFELESERLILSEQSYYDTERYDAYNWQNSIQSYHLNRDTCVFVGFSADDYNFRRILRQMDGGKEKRSKHYLLLTIDPIVRDLYESVCRYHLSMDSTRSIDVIAGEIWEDVKFLLNRILKMREAYWIQHSMHPIWVTISELPDVLLSLAGDNIVW